MKKKVLFFFLIFLFEFFSYFRKNDILKIAGINLLLYNFSVPMKDMLKVNILYKLISLLAGNFKVLKLRRNLMRPCDLKTKSEEKIHSFFQNFYLTGPVNLTNETPGIMDIKKDLVCKYGAYNSPLKIELKLFLNFIINDQNLVNAFYEKDEIKNILNKYHINIEDRKKLGEAFQDKFDLIKNLTFENFKAFVVSDVGWNQDLVIEEESRVYFEKEKESFFELYFIKTKFKRRFDNFLKRIFKSYKKDQGCLYFEKMDYKSV